MRIIPEFIDSEINIFIIKILLLINLLNVMTPILDILTLGTSLLSLYINIKNLGNDISSNQTFILRSSYIISIITILHYSIHLYLYNSGQFFFVFGLFSLIYNLIIEKGYRTYISKCLDILSLFNKKYTNVKNTNGDLNCSICMDSDTDINFVKTSCGHHYHEKCIEQWTKIQSNCPNCRKTIK
jgi:hypothetical protein